MPATQVCQCGRTFATCRAHVVHVHTVHRGYDEYVSNDCHHGKHKRCQLTAPMGGYPVYRSGRCACGCHPWGTLDLGIPPP